MALTIAVRRKPLSPAIKVGIMATIDSLVGIEIVTAAIDSSLRRSLLPTLKTTIKAAIKSVSKAKTTRRTVTIESLRTIHIASTSLTTTLRAVTI